ncbi:MAG: sulfite exporter TauE/SafE family protein [Oscillospiraceae bacterium]|nr:sulfite exporter TauE/SafE family protein [Oscillospiraceae bacterium]
MTSGILNGFAGTGGGIILYFVLKYLNKPENNKNPDNSNNMKDIMATTISAVIPMSIVSSVIYMTKGKIIYKELLTYLPAALIGGIIGAILLDKLKFKIVKKLFAAMIIYAGIKMILK